MSASLKFRRRRAALLAASLCVISMSMLTIRTGTFADDIPYSSPPLFNQTSPLEMQMRLDFEQLCRHQQALECAAIPAELSYIEDDGSMRRLAVSIRIRGRWKLAERECDFPALFIYFNPELSQGTVFEDQTMLPMTTHCLDYHGRYDAHVKVEYLAYRLYSLLTPASIKVRLLQVTYIDSISNRLVRQHAFFTEHFDHVAQRTGKQYVSVERIDVGSLIPQEMVTLAVFQYMIGHLDWSVLQPHNIALFKNEDGSTTPVPYDFDYSGLVNTEYAVPPEGYDIRSVRDRVYRGFCWPAIDWTQLAGNFQAVQSQVQDELAALPKLGFSQRSRVKDYLKRFYKTLAKDDLMRSMIIESCRRLPKAEP